MRRFKPHWFVRPDVCAVGGLNGLDCSQLFSVFSRDTRSTNSLHTLGSCEIGDRIEVVQMRKLLFRRRAVSTMIGGIIVLVLFLTALIATIVLTQQYDIYQSKASQNQAKYVDRLTEKLVGTDPGLDGPPAPLAGPPPVNQYAMRITNVAGIGSQIARIYINSSIPGRGCNPAPCVLNPSGAAIPNTFNSSQSFINPGEFDHQVVLWLPQSIQMLPNDPAGSHSFTIATTRGGLFTFHYPFPPIHGPGGGAGGTGIYLGPLVIIFGPTLISYTSNPSPTVPPLPIGGTNGKWLFPTQQYLIFYVKVYNEGTNKVNMTAQSVFQIQPFGAPSSLITFWIVAPMTSTLCTTLGGDTIPSSPALDCRSSYTGGNSAPPANGQIILYDFTNHPYTIYPNATQPGSCCGKPVYLLFAAQNTGSGITNTAGQIPKGFGPPSSPGGIATFLNLAFRYDDGTGQGTYTWGVDLPFISGCADSCTL